MENTSHNDEAGPGSGMSRRRLATLAFGALGGAIATTALGTPIATAAPWPLKLNTMAELRALPRSPDPVPSETTIELLGYWTAGDGGGGTFHWDPAATDPDDGGTVIILDEDRAAGDRPGRWLRPWDDCLSVRWFGARGDGAALDDTAIAAAFARAATRTGTTVYFPDSTNPYLISHAIRISTGTVSVEGLGRERSTTIKQRTWGLAVFDIRDADDVEIRNLTLRANPVDRSVRPDDATIAEGRVMVYNAGIFSNGSRTSVSNVTIHGFMSGVLLTVYNWPVNRFDLPLREDCRISDVEVHDVDFGLTAVGQLRPVVRRLSGSYSMSYYSAPPHLIYFSGSDANPTTLSYDALIEDCRAQNGHNNGDAYRLGGIVRGRMANCSAQSCDGLISIGDCHDLSLANITSSDDSAPNWSVYVSATSSRVIMSHFKVERKTSNVITVRCEGSDITLDDFDLQVKHAIWPSGPDFRVTGNRNTLRNIKINNTEASGGSLGIQFESGTGHALHSYAAEGVHKGMFVGGAVRNSTFNYDPNLIHLNPDSGITGELTVQYTEPPVSVAADPGVRLNRASSSRHFPSTSPVIVEASAVTDAHIDATGPVTISQTTQQAVGMPLNFHITNQTAAPISITWGSTFDHPVNAVAPGATEHVTFDYRSDRHWHTG
ncbi:glycosyl hydrolase family 28-related protein [Streptomyces xantholiticus]|uniref:glycosyl hydrolase family 28-related protein n=1 Tax=Streptomyces xantholiticus TaxID=68285 RepID=UPI0019BB57B9|nr:glycosyl hydrolase family 28-related protein [Streptomyces xantholiticus]GGW68529.1 hypothetical protein GCM10010381_61740 [Streptomyces xantholiticus]